MDYYYGMTGEELRRMRREAGLTQGQLAEIVRSHRMSVSRWERGTRRITPRSEIVIKLALQINNALEQARGKSSGRASSKSKKR